MSKLVIRAHRGHQAIVETHLTQGVVLFGVDCIYFEDIFGVKQTIQTHSVLSVSQYTESIILEP